MTVTAKVICDSQYGPQRLITLEINLHRFILPEFNTHRTFSRNFQSSRAVPVEKIIDQVRLNPATPIHWGKNQPGMIADEETNVGVAYEWDYDEVYYPLPPTLAWYSAAAEAANIAEAFQKAGYHKQIINRLLEPFMWTRGLVTATKEAYDAFFDLRIHAAAQPEIKALAEKMLEAITESNPKQLQMGEWHLPYVSERDCLPLETAIKVSISCCAQVSYRKLDTSVEKAKKVYDMLNLPIGGTYPTDPPHFSPAEHVARASELLTLDKEYSGNFNTQYFIQYRKLLENGKEQAFV